MVVMETPYTPPVTRATVRRSAVIAAVVAVIAFAVCIPMGYGLYALFGVVGLALGLLNSFMVMRAVVNFAATKPSRGRFTGSVLGRLAVITVLAFAVALLFRPQGVAVFAGIAIYQFVAVMSSMVPLIKEIKKR
ncbi:hypothetical protein ACQEVB_01610 [Pseudonocardia sp. CA-107938]|uniref:hypothetical protein n=1 Tax=Pseudonocardia sp. CA-107938 TaxID=3240021 RepID=UPI003D8C6297